MDVDDTTIYIIDAELTDSNDLKLLELLFSINKPKIKYSKTNATLLALLRKKHLNKNNVKLYVNNCKILGLAIDHNLNWKDHIEKVNEIVS